MDMRRGSRVESVQCLHECGTLEKANSTCLEFSSQTSFTAVGYGFNLSKVCHCSSVLYLFNIGGNCCKSMERHRQDT